MGSSGYSPGSRNERGFIFHPVMLSPPQMNDGVSIISPGIDRSIITMSGLSALVFSTASTPSTASPQISHSAVSSNPCSPLSTTSSSSAVKIRSLGRASFLGFSRSGRAGLMGCDCSLNHARTATLSTQHFYTHLPSEWLGERKGVNRKTWVRSGSNHCRKPSKTMLCDAEPS